VRAISNASANVVKNVTQVLMIPEEASFNVATLGGSWGEGVSRDKYHVSHTFKPAEMPA